MSTLYYGGEVQEIELLEDDDQDVEVGVTLGALRSVRLEIQDLDEDGDVEAAYHTNMTPTQARQVAMQLARAADVAEGLES